MELQKQKEKEETEKRKLEEAAERQRLREEKAEQRKAQKFTFIFYFTQKTIKTTSTI